MSATVPDDDDNVASFSDQETGDADFDYLLTLHSRLFHGKPTQWMEHLMSDLEDRFEAVACLLVVEDAVCTQRAEQGEALSSTQLAIRRHALTERTA